MVHKRDAKLHECKDAKVDLPSDFSDQEEVSLRQEMDTLDSAVDEVKDIVESNVHALHLVCVHNLNSDWYISL